MTELQINKSQFNTNNEHNNNITTIRICGNFFDPRPNQTHQKAKNLDPTQPNPWVDPTHGQLW